MKNYNYQNKDIWPSKYSNMKINDQVYQHGNPWQNESSNMWMHNQVWIEDPEMNAHTYGHLTKELKPYSGKKHFQQMVLGQLAVNM